MDLERDSDVDTRSGFDDLRRSLGGGLEREPGSNLLVRASLEALLGAFVSRAQQRRGAVGLASFEIEDWKALDERMGGQGVAAALTQISLELRRRVRGSDDLGRLGEARIVAILPGCEPPALATVTERLRHHLESRELAIGDSRVRLAIGAVSLSAAPRTGTPTPARLLEELESLAARGSELEPR